MSLSSFFASLDVLLKISRKGPPFSNTLLPWNAHSTEYFLFLSLISKLKALKSTTNLQEKEAILASLEKPTDEVMAASKKDEAETIETIKNLSAEKKKYLLAAAQNFGIATLMAKDLAGGASQISTAIISNPQSLTSSGFTVGGAKNLVGDVTGIAKNSSMALVEVPQLFNIIQGEMSFVGPRPDVVGYADKLEGKDRIILSVKPGITGPAQLKYRNEDDVLSKVEDPIKYNDEVLWKDKVKINVDYVMNLSFTNDLNYIIKTIYSK